MKRKIFLLTLVVLVLVAAAAFGELSTNLGIQKKLNPNNKKVESETYVDASGNAVIADDKGYATVKYTYVTGNRIGKTEYLDRIEELSQISISTIHSFFRKVIVEVGPMLGYGTNVQLKSYILEKKELLLKCKFELGICIELQNLVSQHIGHIKKQIF